MRHRVEEDFLRTTVSLLVFALYSHEPVSPLTGCEMESQISCPGLIEALEFER